MEYDDPPEQVLWACRFREMAMEAGRLEGENARLRETLLLETSMVQGDGTDALLTALYGESSAATIGKAIGGSQAKMLHDAAAEIGRLRATIDALALRRREELEENHGQPS